jgi:hypothetical protein
MAGRSFHHKSYVKVVVFTHDSPNGGNSQALNVSPSVIGLNVEKHIGSEGKWSVMLAPGTDRRPTQSELIKQSPSTAHLDYFRYIQPNDMVAIYLSNGTKGGPKNPTGGYHMQVLGYVDAVSRKQNVDANGAKTKVVTLTGTDHTKAWSKSSLYFNAHMDARKQFGASFAGMKLKHAGIPIGGSVADFARFFLLTPTVFGSQFELPKSLVSVVRSNLHPALSMLVGAVLNTAPLVSSGFSAITNGLANALLLDKSFASHLKSVIEDSGKHVRGNLSYSATTVREMINQLPTMVHLIDLSYIEDLYVRGLRFAQSMSTTEGNIFSALQSNTDPLLNESFFDLRFAGRQNKEPVYGSDFLGLNEDGPIYTPAYILREYPFSTGAVHPSVRNATYRDGRLSLDMMSITRSTEDTGDSEEANEKKKKTNTANEKSSLNQQAEDIEYMLRLLYYVIPIGFDDVGYLYGPTGNIIGSRLKSMYENIVWAVFNRTRLKPQYKNESLFGSTIKEEAIRIGESFNIKGVKNGPSSKRGVRNSKWAKSAFAGITVKPNRPDFDTPLDLVTSILYPKGGDRGEDPTKGCLYFIFPTAVITQARFVDYTVIDIPGDSVSNVYTVSELQDKANRYFKKVKGQDLSGNGYSIPTEYETAANKSTKFVINPAGIAAFDNSDPPSSSSGVPSTIDPRTMPIPSLPTEPVGLTVYFKDPDDFTLTHEVIAVGIRILNTSFTFNARTGKGRDPKMYPSFDNKIPLMPLSELSVFDGGYSADSFIFYGVDPDPEKGGEDFKAYFDNSVRPLDKKVEEEDLEKEQTDEEKKEESADAQKSKDTSFNNVLDMLRSASRDGGNFVDLTNGIFFRNRNSEISRDLPTARALDFTLDSVAADRKKALDKLRYFAGKSTYLTEVISIPGLDRRFIDHVTVHRDEVISEDFTRSDAEHINLFAVYANFFSDNKYMKPIFNEWLPIMSELGFRRNGLRVLEQSSSWHESAFTGSFKGMVKANVEISMLLDMFYQHNSAYITGSLVLRGRPDIKVGYRLDYDVRTERNPSGEDLSFYVEGVSNAYAISQDGSVLYTTTVTLTRGQPQSPSERLPYVPPNWYINTLLNDTTGFYNLNTPSLEEVDARLQATGLPEDQKRVAAVNARRAKQDAQVAEKASSGRVFRDVSLSQAPYRNNKADFINKVNTTPGSVESYRFVPDMLKDE